MPGKNTVKTYVEGGLYHIYNRGVEKRSIFPEATDFNIFQEYLKEYLSPRDEKAALMRSLSSQTSSQDKFRIQRSMVLNNYSSDITLLAYCLMPNHYHFFVKQHTINGINRFMSSLASRYVMYFNRKYDRVGSLFQGVYRAVLMTSDAQFLHITRYIHRQGLPKESNNRQAYPSSLPEYLGLRKSEWVHPEEVLELFSGNNLTLSYQQFIMEDNPLFESVEREIDL